MQGRHFSGRSPSKGWTSCGPPGWGTCSQEQWTRGPCEPWLWGNVRGLLPHPSHQGSRLRREKKSPDNQNEDAINLWDTYCVSGPGEIFTKPL